MLHGLFFFIYLKLVARDVVRLRFASPKQLILRWKLLKSFADLALADPNDPKAKDAFLNAWTKKTDGLEH
jgi:hypothetical protein